MDEQKLDNLKLIANTYTDVCMNAKTFEIILREQTKLDGFYDPMTLRIYLKKGFMGTLNKTCRLWISRDVNDGYVNVRLDKENLSLDADGNGNININERPHNWDAIIKLEDYHKLES